MYLFWWILHGEGIRDYRDARYSIEYSTNPTKNFTLSNLFGWKARHILVSKIMKAKMVVLLQRLDSLLHQGHYNCRSGQLLLPHIFDPIQQPIYLKLVERRGWPFTVDLGRTRCPLRQWWSMVFNIKPLRFPIHHLARQLVWDIYFFHPLLQLKPGTTYICYFLLAWLGLMVE